MRLLYTSTSMAFTQLARLTLDREGIEYFCSDADSSLAGIGTPMAGGQSRIYVQHDADVERAVELMRKIGAPSRKATYSPVATKKHPWWLMVAAGAMILVVVGAILGN